MLGGTTPGERYHRLILAAVPPGCQRALDVGCGEGTLARQLTRSRPSRRVAGEARRGEHSRGWKTVRVVGPTNRQNTTHDWVLAIDAGHLAHIRRNPATFAPGGVLHLVLEVIAYAADEAGAGDGRCLVTFHGDGSVSVSDDGRGTATRLDRHGNVQKKPVMSTKDLRFFDSPDGQVLPDGYPRRGISVVAALSEWLVHTNRRWDGAWTQRYEHGVPVTDLVHIPGNGATGTMVRFRPDETVPDSEVPAVIAAAQLAGLWRGLSVEVVQEQRSGAKS